MGLDERIAYLLLGCAIGFVLGYIVRFLHEIKEELDEVKDEVGEVDMIVKSKRNQHRQEDGFVKLRVIADLALFVVVAITVWAAFASQAATNKAQNALDETERVAICNQEALTKTIKALNERTEAVRAQSDANVALQRDQADFFTLILARPLKPENERRAAAQEYLDSLTNFVEKSGTARQKSIANPYPTNSELARCVRPDEFPTQKESPR
jgi:uncharacterized protein YoxC